MFARRATLQLVIFEKHQQRVLLRDSSLFLLSFTSIPFDPIRSRTPVHPSRFCSSPSILLFYLIYRIRCFSRAIRNIRRTSTSNIRILTIFDHQRTSSTRSFVIRIQHTLPVNGSYFCTLIVRIV